MGIIEAQELNSFLPADDNCDLTRFATSCEKCPMMVECYEQNEGVLE